MQVLRVSRPLGLNIPATHWYGKQKCISGVARREVNDSSRVRMGGVEFLPVPLQLSSPCFRRQPRRTAGGRQGNEPNAPSQKRSTGSRPEKSYPRRGAYPAPLSASCGSSAGCSSSHHPSPPPALACLRHPQRVCSLGSPVRAGQCARRTTFHARQRTQTTQKKHKTQEHDQKTDQKSDRPDRKRQSDCD